MAMSMSPYSAKSTAKSLTFPRCNPFSAARTQQEAGMDARVTNEILRHCIAADVLDFKCRERRGIELETRVIAGEDDRATRRQQFVREMQQLYVVALHVEVLRH